MEVTWFRVFGSDWFRVFGSECVFPFFILCPGVWCQLVCKTSTRRERGVVCALGVAAWHPTIKYLTKKNPIGNVQTESVVFVLLGAT